MEVWGGLGGFSLSTGPKITEIWKFYLDSGRGGVTNYRSRLVAREINTSARPDLFAATPPLESMKILLSSLTTGNHGQKLMVNDVSRAFFCAPARRQVFAELPPEDSDHGRMVGELNNIMYVT